MTKILNTKDFNLSYKDVYADLPFGCNEENICGIRAIISTIDAGNMSLNRQVSDERLLLFSKLNVDPNNVYSCEQTHSRDVCVAENSILIKQADGLIGMAPSILSVTVADCLPVFLYDSKNNVFAVCHSGWKGTGIAVSALHLMQNNFNTNAKDVFVILGPCIQAVDYKVDKDRALKFSADFGIDEFSNNGEYFIDMQRANSIILYNEGVKNILRCTNSTFTDKRLGSFRREGKNFTKMIAMIGFF